MTNSRDHHRPSRRGVLTSSVAAFIGGAAVRVLGTEDLPVPSEPRVMTVRGPVSPADLGRTLAHEHVVVDFIGAARVSPERYDSDAAFETALPHVRAVKERGVGTLVECTPAFIGRNPSLLLRLSKEADLHFVTNAGWYAAVHHRYLPPDAQTESADRIARRWLDEWKEGIEGTGVRPGFLKLGTGNGPLPAVDAKLLRAAAAVHHEAGLSIFVHTGDGKAALDEIRILGEERVRPEALVWVHAQNDPGPIQIEAAKRGAWISLDGYSLAVQNRERYPNMLAAHREAGTLGRVLISHDDGWAVDGDGARGNGLKLFGNGNREPYQSVFTHLLPELKRRGFGEAQVDQMLRVNPSEALTIRRRVG
jgi:phosphotriesterase-related protein